MLAGAPVALVAVPASGQNSPIAFDVKDYSTVHVTVGQTFTITVTESGAEPTFEWGVTDGVSLGPLKFGVGTVFNKTNASWIFVSGPDNSTTATISGTVPAMAISTSVDLVLNDPGYHTPPYTGGAGAGVVIYITVAAEPSGAPKTTTAPTSSTAPATTAKTPPFTPSGSFDNPGTKSGVYTSFGASGKFDSETAERNGVELVYQVGAHTSACAQIAIIQVIWYTDADGAVKKFSEAVPAVANAAAKDSASSNGYSIDFASNETTPYYQDNDNGVLINGLLGSSNGTGGGTPSHISDAPSAIQNGWRRISRTGRSALWATMRARCSQGPLGR